MKSFFTAFIFLIATTSFAGEYEAMELHKLPKGSSINFRKPFIIEAKAETETLAMCELQFEASPVNRKFSLEHSLVLIDSEVEVKNEDMDWECTGDIENEDRHCDYTKRDVSYYTLVFDVYKKNVLSNSSPIKAVCKDSSVGQVTVEYFRDALEATENFYLKIHDDAVDF